MRTFSKLAVYALLSSALLSACSRPYATYQKMPVERFGSRQEVPAVQATPTQAEDVAVVSVETPALTPAEQATPLTTAAALKNVEQKLQEAVARNDNKLAGNKKLEKRMARVQTMLAEASAKSAATTTKASASALTPTHKMNLAERMMMKKIDKKIKNSLAPDEAKAMSRTLRAGVILGVVGLILVILGIPVLSLIGLLALIAGLVLILVDVLAQS
ncbi:hypothetical protein [Larkinella humicola]|uniref:Uncharacterized protein n=1 Tax=Larkinella humicola TaxID=2607654 RepID=A0A5N1JJ08_9BACT|nr:hypothetical protein [Larkinella humicola]KAA9354671.1 hypothetical protein F0P93_08670 [Larkinella humicola]